MRHYKKVGIYVFKKLDELLDEFLGIGIPGNDCTVYYKGNCVYRRFAGFSDKENKIPMNGKELYNIYSCSKVITCVAALQLYEKGLFRLEDNLSEYMPEFKTMYVRTEDGIKKAANQITVKDLFCMTAGFSYDLNSPMIKKCQAETNGKCRTVELMKHLAKEPLLFEPGTRWEYSLCHDVLAALVEVISGVRFGEYVKKNIFDVLGMNNSTFLLDDSKLDLITPLYYFDNETEKIVKRPKTIDYKLGSEYESGGAGCISTVDDYIKFLEALRIGNVILKKETIDMMSKNQITAEQAKSCWVAEGYGYGLGVRCPNGSSEITDFGWGGAAGAYLAVDRSSDMTVFYAQHVLNPPNNEQRGKIGPLVKEIINENYGF